MGIEVTEDAEDKRRKYFNEVLARRGQGDRSALVNKDPSKHYRFRKAASPQDLEKYTFDGFTATKPSENGVAGVATAVFPDGTIRLKGDLVLMEQDRELFEMKRNQDQERARARMEKQIEQTREETEKYARDNGLVKPHKEATSYQSKEGGESMTVRRKRLPE